MKNHAQFTTGWALAYLFVVIFALSSFTYSIPEPDHRIDVLSVEYTPSIATHPDELINANWEPAAFPHHWANTDHQNTSLDEAWYRVMMAAPAQTDELLGILLPSITMNAAIFFNGIEIGRGGQFQDPVARHWVQPFLANIPATLIQPGTNEILIRVKGLHAGHGSLSDVIIAPQSELYDMHETIEFLRVGVVQMITAVLIAMGLLSCLLWSIRRQETIYGYFGLANLIWAVHNLNVLVRDIPIPTRIWEWIAYATIGYFGIAMMHYTHRFVGQCLPQREKAITLFMLLASLSLLTLPEDLFYFAAEQVWYLIVFILGAYVIIKLIVEGWRQKHNEIQALALCGVLILIYSAHDIMVFLGFDGWERGLYLHYAAPVLLGVFGSILIRRFVASVAETEVLNRELEQRVEEKSKQLEINFRRLNKLENEKLLAQERERITRDMHDGMGGTLVSTLAMVESGNTEAGRIKESLRGALSDMRLMIDSLDSAGGDLLTMLGMFRERVTPQLHNAGLTFDWQVKLVPDIPEFGPEKALQIMRILQEFVTNTLKHAQARTITLSTETREEAGQRAVILTIRDDGTGIQKNPHRPTGYGLNNMQKRAKLINVALQLDSSDQGTRIILTLPLETISDNTLGTAAAPA